MICAYMHNMRIIAITCAECADAHNAQQRTCAYAHYAPLRIVCAEYASAHHIRGEGQRNTPLIFAHSVFSIPWFLFFFSGGGGSCRRQGKSAAPSGRRGERPGRYRRVSPVSSSASLFTQYGGCSGGPVYPRPRGLGSPLGTRRGLVVCARPPLAAVAK